MALKNDQYNALMRIYDLRRQKAQRELQERRSEIYGRVPELLEVQNALSANGAARARAGILRQEDRLPELLAEEEELLRRKSDILKRAGIDEAELQPKYQCPDCGDTGFIGNARCHCFVQEAVDLLYNRSNIRGRLEKENFDVLSMDFYRKESEDGKLSEYDYMSERIRECRDFVRNFDEKGGNLLFYGSTGVGKTFLSNCIAKALLDSCHSVVYFTAIELIDLFTKNMNGFQEEEQEQADQFVLDSDLLIIDDLGTERMTSFASGRMFYTINERLVRGKSTIISTNLNPNSLTELYTERIASRLLGNYRLIQIVGNDIRIQKKFKALRSETSGR